MSARPSPGKKTTRRGFEISGLLEKGLIWLKIIQGRNVSCESPGHISARNRFVQQHMYIFSFIMDTVLNIALTPLNDFLDSMMLCYLY